MAPQFTMQLRVIRKEVEKWQTPNTRPAIEHYHDLLRSSMRLYNELCKSIATLEFGSSVAIVAAVSNLIEVDEVMKDMLREDDAFMKRGLVYWYHEEGQANGIQYARPKMVGTFNQFGLRRNKAKDMAIHIVLKMYGVWVKGDIPNRSSRHSDYRYPVGAKWSLYSNCCKPGKSCSE